MASRLVVLNLTAEPRVTVDNGLSSSSSANEIARKKYDFKFDKSSFDFESAPDPPEDYSAVFNKIIKTGMRACPACC
jgi:hypothetical protein